jgi:predicted lipoprotein with Yx(FWY)xxD motif
MSHRTTATTTRAALTLLAAAALTFATAATAKAPTPIVKAKKNAAVAKTIVVNAKGATLYRLKPETTKRVLCDATCLPYWPPLTVKSASVKLVAGPGVKGKLTVFRSDGKFRVALRGYPLYTFVGDTKAGSTSGNNVQSFGGTWLVVSAK